LIPVLLVGTAVFAEVDPAPEAPSDEAAQQAKLAKMSQNPVANMISVPFEFWHNEGENGTGFSMVAKPVIPTPLGSMNLINRLILPYASIDGAMEMPDTGVNNAAVDENGLADITYQGFFSPAKPGALIWGAGFALQMPTASSDALGSDLWSAGPSVLLLTMPGKWVVGLLAQNVWDFAGSGDGSVNKMTLQPIVNYTLKNGWYLTSAPAWTADWNAESGEQWNVPLGAGVGKVQKLGKLPVDFKLVYYNYVAQRALGPDWSVLLGIKLIIPTG